MKQATSTLRGCISTRCSNLKGRDENYHIVIVLLVSLLQGFLLHLMLLGVRTRKNLAENLVTYCVAVDSQIEPFYFSLYFLFMPFVLHMFYRFFLLIVVMTARAIFCSRLLASLVELRRVSHDSLLSVFSLHLILAMDVTNVLRFG